MSKSHPDQYAQLLEKEEQLKVRKSTLKNGQEKKANEPSITSMLNKSVYTTKSIKYLSIARKLAIFIGCANVSTRLVENQEFRDLIQELDPRFPVPGRTKITTELSKIFADMKSSILKDLRIARKIHFCCDIWSKKRDDREFHRNYSSFFCQS